MFCLRPRNNSIGIWAVTCLVSHMCIIWKTRSHLQAQTVIELIIHRRSRSSLTRWILHVQSVCSKTPGSSSPFHLTVEAFKVQSLCGTGPGCPTAVWQWHQPEATSTRCHSWMPRALSGGAGLCAYQVPRAILSAQKKKKMYSHLLFLLNNFLRQPYCHPLSHRWRSWAQREQSNITYITRPVSRRARTERGESDDSPCAVYHCPKICQGSSFHSRL